MIYLYSFLIFMNNINKYSKKQLIDIIIIHYLKDGKIIETNLNKINKKKLISLIIDENISIYNNNKIIQETIEIENYTNYLEIIYYNFMRFNNIPLYLIKEIKNNKDLTSNDLFLIINENNLIIENDIYFMKKFNKMIFTISDAIYHFDNKLLKFKTLPDIINVLKNFH